MWYVWVYARRTRCRLDCPCSMRSARCVLLLRRSFVSTVSRPSRNCWWRKCCWIFSIPCDRPRSEMTLWPTILPRAVVELMMEITTNKTQLGTLPIYKSTLCFYSPYIVLSRNLNTVKMRRTCWSICPKRAERNISYYLTSFKGVTSSK